MRFLWGGPSCGKGCPMTDAGSHSTARRHDREIKLLSQLWSLVVGELQVLRQPLMQIEDWEPSDQSPQVASHQGESTRRQAQSPSPMWLRQGVTFEDNPWEDTRAGEPCPLTWEDDERTGEQSDWSRPENRPDEEDLRCPPALNPSSPRVSIRRRCPLDWRWNRGQPPVDLYAWILPTEYPWMDWLVCTAGEHTSLMAGTLGSSQPGWPPGNLPEECGHHFNYQRWVAMLPKWRMTTLSHQHPTP